MDLNAIKKRLNQLQTTNNRTSSLWKPQPGKTQIRIVPYAFNKDNPFIELFFHYNLNNRSYLSPISFGRPDPIEEFAQKLKGSGSKEDYQLSRKLEAKMRTFAPVLVRGEEKQGVKFWGFGKTVYQELLSVIADPDYGDITDPVNGRDVVVEFISAEESGASFPKTNIRVKPNQTPISEEPDVLELVKSQQDIKEIYQELSYDDLTEVLNEWLNPSDSDEEESNEKVSASELSTAKVSDAGEAFDELFNS
jgi:hypothetical protein|tara:strand:+ start:160 stop:909 length:750 start_codon:yes stop_codon:yes gene_type:complete